MSLFKSKIKVVPWNEYFPDIESTTPDRKRFYKKWKSRIKRGKRVDLGENLSYIFVYLYECINKYLEDRDIRRLEGNFEIIKNLYPNSKAIFYLNDWLEDAYILEKDFKSAYNLSKSKENKNIEDILFYASKLDRKTSLTGKEFLDIVGYSFLTDFGKKNISEIEKLLDVFLDNFEIKHKMNFFEYFMKDLKKGKISEKEVEEYKKFYIKESDFYKYKSYDDQQIQTSYKDNYISNYTKRLFQGVINHTRQTEEVVEGINITFEHTDHSMIELKTEILQLGHVLKNAMFNEGKRILRETENTYREESGIPKIGEGWVSETELFYKLINAFPQHEIIHHGRPKWLGRQHLDIYFPELNIGVEYQGKQHLEPVEYFGGESSFKKQQKRDERKRDKCKRNKCSLIYVYDDYNFEDIKNQIEQEIRKKE